MSENQSVPQGPTEWTAEHVLDAAVALIRRGEWREDHYYANGSGELVIEFGPADGRTFVRFAPTNRASVKVGGELVYESDIYPFDVALMAYRDGCAAREIREKEYEQANLRRCRERALSALSVLPPPLPSPPYVETEERIARALENIATCMEAIGWWFENSDLLSGKKR